MADEKQDDSPYRQDDGGTRKELATLRKKFEELKADNAKYRERERSRVAAGDENATSRELLSRISTLEQERDRLKDDLDEKQPKDGEVVVSAERARALAQFEALKLTPAQVAELQKKNGDLQGQLDQVARERVDAEAAAALDWKPKVLSKLRQTEGLAIEMRDATVEVDGKQETKKVPHVRPVGDEKAEWKPLGSYADQHLTDFLPALKRDATGAGGSGGAGQGTRTEGQRMFDQSPRGTAPNPKDAVGDFIKSTNERNAKRANPLRPATATTR